MPSSPPAIQKKNEYRHFFLKFGIPGFVVFILFIGGFRNIVIIAGEARTMATVTQVRSSEKGRAAIYYKYEVNGQTYNGSGAPDHEPFTPPYSTGTTYEIRYSRAYPSFSTPHNPYTIFGQFIVGSLFLVWADYMATANEKRKSSKAIRDS